MPVPGTIERRFAGELRATGRKLVGYAAPFNVETQIGGFTEIIRPGAFAQSLREQADILALADHSRNALLARTKSGTLRLAEDNRGLAFDLDLPETTVGRDVLALAERGDLGGMSFEFRARPNGGDRWSKNGRYRELISVELSEISVISAFPAYNSTEVQARSQPISSVVKLRRFLEIEGLVG